FHGATEAPAGESPELLLAPVCPICFRTIICEFYICQGNKVGTLGSRPAESHISKTRRPGAEPPRPIAPRVLAGAERRRAPGEDPRSRARLRSLTIRSIVK